MGGYTSNDKRRYPKQRKRPDFESSSGARLESDRVKIIVAILAEIMLIILFILMMLNKDRLCSPPIALSGKFACSPDNREERSDIFVDFK
jgi:hypothetical protein